MGGIIQETLRYRSNVRPMAGVDTLTQASDSSESDQPEMPFGFYRGKRPLRPCQARSKGAQQRQRCGMTETAKKGGSNQNRESLLVYKNASAATAAEGGEKAVKTVGNTAVVSNSPSDSLTAGRSGGGGAKIAAMNVKAATGGGSGGVKKALPSGGGGGGGGGRGRILIGAEAEIVGGIGVAYYLDLILDSALSKIRIGGVGGSG